jgi:alpha-galactosidase
MPEARFEETDAGPALHNGAVHVQVHLNRGTFDLIDLAAGRTVLRDAAVSVALKEGPTFSTRGEELEFEGTRDVDDVHGHGVSIVLVREADMEEEPDLSFTITVYDDHPYAIIRAEVQNLLPAPIRVQTFHLLDGATLDVGATPESLAFYKHGWQSWSPTLVLACAGEDVPASPPVSAPGTQPPPAPGRFVSDLVTAVVDPAADYGVVAGFVTAADQFSHLWFDRDASSLSAASWADGVEVAPKAVLASETLCLQPSARPALALERYGAVLAREMEALPVTGVTSGWCSWYYYFQGVSEDEVMANLEFLAANREALPVEYVQIDDGYQSEIGDWLTPNEKFPHGMKWLADEIHACGYKAGLWLAPFLAGVKSRLFKEHPEWFVQYATGGPAVANLNWGQICHALDLTHPEALAWLETTFRTICDDWGYDYVKIDFIYAGGIDGIRRDANVTRAQAYRRGLEAIRDAVGSRFVLACGNPMGPSIGLVEGARISPDVAPYWRSPVTAQSMSLSVPSALNAIRATITRFWMHGRLWANDPDCLLVRETDTALAGDEVRALATVIGLSGGMVLDSDKLPKLSDERRDLISLLLPVYGKSAVPVDLFQTPDLPALFELDCGTHRLLGVFNWSDESADVDVTLPEGRWHAFELWEREYLGVVSGSLALPTPPHGCRLLRLTPDQGRPQVVGSTLQITMGAMEIATENWDGARLRITLRPVAKQSGELYVARDGRIEVLPVEGLTAMRTIEA